MSADIYECRLKARGGKWQAWSSNDDGPFGALRTFLDQLAPGVITTLHFPDGDERQWRRRIS